MLKFLKAVIVLFVVVCRLFFALPNASAFENPRLMNVVFLAPAAEGDSFWGLVVDFMQAAAKDLEVELEVVYCQRAHYVIKQKGMEVISRENKPDYLILVNELSTAGDLIKEADAVGIKTLLFNEIFLGEDSLTMGAPQQIYKNWILELRPDDYQSGYLLAEKLYQIKRKHKGKYRKINVAGITGPEDNNSSILRVNGLQEFCADNPDINLLQVTSADYSEEKSAHISAGLLKRYPELDIIWTASDRMAIGAYSAISDAKADVLTGGVDWDMGAIKSLSDGGIDVSVGGHFMDGAWLLIMLYDYHHGINFERLKPKSSFKALTYENIDLYLDNFGDNDWDKIDFTKYSKILNEKINEYNFQLEELMAK